MPESSHASTTAEIVKILELCRDIELGCAALYHTFAGLFGEEAQFADLWLKTAREEENHAKQFEFALNMRREPLVETIMIDIAGAIKTLEQIRQIGASIKENRPAASDALQMAITLELELVEFHSTSVLSFTDESHRKLFAAMMKADNRHIETLREMREQLQSL